MSDRRVPPKQRHRERPIRRVDRPADDSSDDPARYSAPGHQGGQFDEHGYGDGHGTFGFTQWVNP